MVEPVPLFDPLGLTEQDGDRVGDGVPLAVSDGEADEALLVVTEGAAEVDPLSEATGLIERDPDMVVEIDKVTDLDGGPDSVVVTDTNADADTLTDTVTIPLRDVAPEGVSVVVVV